MASYGKNYFGLPQEPLQVVFSLNLGINCSSDPEFSIIIYIYHILMVMSIKFWRHKMAASMLIISELTFKWKTNFQII